MFGLNYALPLVVNHGSKKGLVVILEATSTSVWAQIILAKKDESNSVNSSYAI